MKLCTRCNKVKPASGFYKDSSKRDGLCSRCKCCAADHHAAWRAANPEKHNANGAKYRAANPDKERERCAKYSAAHPDKIRARQAKYRSTHPEFNRISLQNRRARIRESGGKLSRDLAERLFKLQRGKCACGCKQPLGSDYHLDHIMPLALGGTNTDDNIQLLRSECNLQKSAKHPVNFMQQRGFLL